MRVTHTPQEFVDHSIKLIQAQPTTTIVTTKYSASEPQKGRITLKTYDPDTGVVIKFKTSKIADVGRLVAGLNRLARQQTGALEPPPDVPMLDAGQTPIDTPAAGTTPVPGASAIAPPPPEPAKGKGKKKRKGGK